MRTVFTLLWTALLFNALPAAAAPAGVDKESRYDIEVLVFENRLPDLVGDELLGKDPATLRQKAIDNAVPAEAVTGESYLQPQVAQLLERDGHYRVLAHAHWQQTLEPNPKSPVKAVRVAGSGGSTPAELEGAVRFYMSRFLHLDVNMQFRITEPGAPAPVTYAINEQRRLKSQETHYFDHPRFGVLVRVMPLDAEVKP